MKIKINQDELKKDLVNVEKELEYKRRRLANFSYVRAIIEIETKNIIMLSILFLVIYPFYILLLIKLLG